VHLLSYTLPPYTIGDILSQQVIHAKDIEKTGIDFWGIKIECPARPTENKLTVISTCLNVQHSK
jgi:hypothetical protein